MTRLIRSFVVALPMLFAPILPALAQDASGVVTFSSSTAGHPLPQGWHLHGPDGGGAGAVPEDFTLVIRQVSQGMQVTLTRKGERAHLAYALTTFERR